MKRLIFCSDGTWNKENQKDEGTIAPTNVYKLFHFLEKQDANGIQQIASYDKGVGTDWYDKITGGLFGMGINQNIIDAYTFLVDNYEVGDEIYLFGFSRGAFTARSVAGFIYNSGLLTTKNKSKIEEAFLLYKSRDADSKPMSKTAIDFREKYCYPQVTIKCVGVWDTVGELGVPIELFENFNKDILQCRFYDVRLNKYVENAFHALAIDEHRKPFDASLWQQTPEGIELGQVSEQVWFTGVHCDVGGGYKNTDLSDITLKWMIEKVQKLGLAFKKNIIIQGNPHGEMHDSMKIYYKILGSINRQIGLGEHYNESIAPSVIERWNTNSSNYQFNANPNLKKYIND